MSFHCPLFWFGGRDRKLAADVDKGTAIFAPHLSQRMCWSGCSSDQSHCCFQITAAIWGPHWSSPRVLQWTHACCHHHIHLSIRQAGGKISALSAPQALPKAGLPQRAAVLWPLSHTIPSWLIPVPQTAYCNQYFCCINKMWTHIGCSVMYGMIV